MTTLSPPLFVALLFSLSACAGTSKSKKSEADVRCSIAQFQQDPNALSLCQDDCAAGIADACTTLGTMHHRGHLAPQSHEDAIVFADKGCALDDLQGCFYAGSWRSESDDQKARVEALEKACHYEKMVLLRDKQFACFESATAYLNGFGVTPDKERGVMLANLACRAGSFDACDGNFNKAPVYADSGITTVEEKPKDEVDAPSVQLSMGSVEADGLKLNDVSCQLKSGGMMAGLMIVGVLSKQKSAFDACGAKKDVSLTWAVESGGFSTADASSEEADVAACVKTALQNAQGLPDGTCTAVLPAPQH